MKSQLDIPASAKNPSLILGFVKREVRNEEGSVRQSWLSIELWK